MQYPVLGRIYLYACVSSLLHVAKYVESKRGKGRIYVFISFQFNSALNAPHTYITHPRTHAHRLTDNHTHIHTLHTCAHTDRQPYTHYTPLHAHRLTDNHTHIHTLHTCAHTNRQPHTHTLHTRARTHTQLSS